MNTYIIEYDAYDDILELLGHEIPHSNLENVKTVIVDLTTEEYEALVGAGITIEPNAKCELLYLPSYISLTATTTLPTEIQSYLKADAAHLAGFTGAGVNVALLDTGCNDICAAAIPTVIRQTYTTQGIHTDNYLHGSYGALLIAQSKKLSDGSTFIGGIAPGCQLYTMNVFDGGYASVVSAISWCIDNNIHIINMSFSMPTTLLNNAVAAALAANIIVVCASGNAPLSNVATPASIAGVIAVNAIDSSALPTLNVFGSYITLDGATQITTTFHNLGGAEIRVGGTSQAAQMTSALMALYKQKYPSLNCVKAIRLLQRKALKLDGHTYSLPSATRDTFADYQTGAGFTSPIY